MKALRLHDQLGLLRPDQVDPASGYRRYREPDDEVCDVAYPIEQGGQSSSMR